MMIFTSSTSGAVDLGDINHNQSDAGCSHGHKQQDEAFLQHSHTNSWLHFALPAFPPTSRFQVD